MKKGPKRRIDRALYVAFRWSQIDGDHHKAWVIDKMVRALTGGGKAYRDWVREYEHGQPGEDLPEPYDWWTGITP